MAWWAGVSINGVVGWSPNQWRGGLESQTMAKWAGVPGRGVVGWSPNQWRGSRQFGQSINQLVNGVRLVSPQSASALRYQMSSGRSVMCPTASPDGQCYRRPDSSSQWRGSRQFGQSINQLVNVARLVSQSIGQ